MTKFEWLADFTLGLVSALEKLNLLRVANQDVEEHIAAQQESAVIEINASEQFLMGSERINRALQNVLSLEGNHMEQIVYIPAVENVTKQKYSMGSESLDKLLDEIMVSKMDRFNSCIALEPAVEL